MGLGLTSNQVVALDRRTEGWIAGLQMAAISMLGSNDVSGFVHKFTGSHRFILDYLTEEVLNQQSEHTREFLLKTSILDRMTGPLCDAITGRSGGYSTLAALEAANIFVTPLDEERRWYRYHPLFADLLRKRLQQNRPNQLPEFHRRASEWLQENGSMSEAVSHALAAGDPNERQF